MMNPEDSNSTHDPLDALVDWDQHRASNNSVVVPAFHAGKIVGLAKKRKRKRVIAACSIVAAFTGIASMAVVNLPSSPSVIRPESVDIVRQQPIEEQSEFKQPEDLQVAENPIQADPANSLVSFNEQLAMVDSSLSGFNQLKGSVARLNKIDRASSVQQYQMHRNLAMLEVLKSALPDAN